MHGFLSYRNYKHARGQNDRRRPSSVNTIFVLSHMYPENPEGTQVIVGSVNMGYISDTARNRTHNLFRPKREPIPLGHSDSEFVFVDFNGT